MQDIWTVKDILTWCEDYLARKNDPNPRGSAQWLLSEALGLSRIELYTNFDKPLSGEERACMREWVRRRGQGEPLQLICGTAPFRYLTLEVAPGVLIPRPETEVLVSEALAELGLGSTVAHVVETEEGSALLEPEGAEVRVLDMCTGSGCIACAIASEQPAAQVVAVDIAPEALALSTRNVERCGLEGRVQVMGGDLFSGLDESFDASFDLVISNPPYIPTAVLAQLPDEVSNFEPELALDGGADGLVIFDAMLPDVQRVLKAGGVFAVELHEECLDAAAERAQAAGFEGIKIAADLAGKPRILIARKRA